MSTLTTDRFSRPRARLDAPASRAVLRAAAALAPMIVLAGCAAFPDMQSVVTRPDARLERTSADGRIGGETSADGRARVQASTLYIPAPPAPPAATRQPATPEQISALVSDTCVCSNPTHQSLP